MEFEDWQKHWGTLKVSPCQVFQGILAGLFRYRLLEFYCTVFGEYCHKPSLQELNWKMDLREWILCVLEKEKIIWWCKWQRRKLKNWKREKALEENLQLVVPGLHRRIGKQRALADAVESLYRMITSREEYGKQLKKKGLCLSNALPCILPKIRDLVSLLFGD